ncbi:hypothetical protein DFH07DRAFT_954108 [Mycena maculata]|uniref:Uncharacterized protein n=1 Tax=Mycena maculata TaxID=230809 RepID=A0AAD7NPK5_9AGAR|nr:hypothetical protein DFH07DRAFT_954108 [Mycena maculata]
MPEAKHLKLSMLIKYKAEKIAAWRLDDHLDNIARLRNHLTLLRMPHPKGANVSPMDDEGLRFFWVTEEDSALHCQVARAIREKKKERKETMNCCCITAIEMTAEPHNPPAAPNNPLVAPPLLLPLASKRDSFSNLLSLDAEPDAIHANPIEKQVQEFLDGLQLDSPATAAQEVEMEVEMGPPLPPSPQRATSVPSSTCSSRNESPASQPPDMNQGVSAAQCDDESMDISAESSAEQATAKADDTTMEARTSIIQNSIMKSPSPIPGLNGTFPIPNATVEEPMQEDPPEKAQPPPSLTVVNELSKTLMDIRKEVASHIIKERAILQALNDIDAPVPQPADADAGPQLPSSDHDFAARVRLQLLKNDLESARLKRLAVEQSVMEIAKECRVPFVYPALMDAFIGVSQLSTQAMGTD